MVASRLSGLQAAARSVGHCCSNLGGKSSREGKRGEVKEERGKKRSRGKIEEEKGKIGS